MKRASVPVVALILVASILVPMTSRVDAQQAGTAIAGDANCDGITDSVDALIILQFDAGLVPSIPCATNGDVNGDGANNSIDATLILQLVAGLFPHFV